MRRCAMLLMAAVLGASMCAQAPEKGKQVFSFSLGVADVAYTEHAEEELDFMNYLHNENGSLEYILVKWGYAATLGERFWVDARLVMMDDLIPDNFDFRLFYRLSDAWSIGAGTLVRKQYVSYYDEYHKTRFPGWALMDQNLQQHRSYDWHFFAVPQMSFGEGRRFEGVLGCDLGLAHFSLEEVSFLHKRINSNEKMRYHYATKRSLQPFVQPRFVGRLRLFSWGKKDLGLQINAAYAWGLRSMPYRLAVQHWTVDGALVKEVRPPKHGMGRFELDFGVFWAW